jgi:hypothetical protein
MAQLRACPQRRRQHKQYTNNCSWPQSCPPICKTAATAADAQAGQPAIGSRACSQAGSANCSAGNIACPAYTAAHSAWCGSCSSSGLCLLPSAASTKGCAARAALSSSEARRRGQASCAIRWWRACPLSAGVHGPHSAAMDRELQELAAHVACPALPVLASAHPRRAGALRPEQRICLCGEAWRESVSNEAFACRPRTGEGETVHDEAST